MASNSMFQAMLEGYTTEHIKETIAFAETHKNSGYEDILDDLRKELKKREKVGA